jgi:hypothetical protein
MPGIVVLVMCFATSVSGITCGLAIWLLHDLKSYYRSRKVWRLER